MSQTGVEKTTLAAGGFAALLASACCVGVSGAWIGNLTRLELFRPIFIDVALVAMFLAYRRIYRPIEECKPGEVCALPATRRIYKVLFWIVSALVVAALGFPYVLPLLY